MCVCLTVSLFLKKKNVREVKTNSCTCKYLNSCHHVSQHLTQIEKGTLDKLNATNNPKKGTFNVLNATNEKEEYY